MYASQVWRDKLENEIHSSATHNYQKFYLQMLFQQKKLGDITTN